jgi:hypothetical protein
LARRSLDRLRDWKRAWEQGFFVGSRFKAIGKEKPMTKCKAYKVIYKEANGTMGERLALGCYALATIKLVLRRCDAKVLRVSRVA